VLTPFGVVDPAHLSQDSTLNMTLGLERLKGWCDAQIVVGRSYVRGMTMRLDQEVPAIGGDLAGSVLSVDELGSRIAGMAGRLAAATCQWLQLVAEFDARDGCARYGLGSTARWLAHHCGIAHRTAVEHVRVARALAQFPALTAEMQLGRLSYSQVRAISRVPHEGEYQVVDDLIQLALSGTAAQLELVARGMRTVEHNGAAGDGDVPDESVRHDWTSQSQWQLNARLNPERGALVQSALDQIARAEGVAAADALTRMAEIAIAAINDTKRPPRPLRGDERAAVVIHMQATDAARAISPPRSAERGRAVAQIEGGPGLPRAVAERLLCSGRIRTVVHDELGNICNVGRARRTVTDRQFRALLARDRHCTHPGCTSKAGVEAHHVKRWIDGGRTELTNLVLLCERHHHALHDGAFEITPLGRQKFRFQRNNGRVLLERVDPSAVDVLHDPWSDAPAIPDDAATPRWRGERLDRSWAISVLSQRREASRQCAS
jgi:hypothetical protein